MKKPRRSRSLNPWRQRRTNPRSEGQCPREPSWTNSKRVEPQTAPRSHTPRDRGHILAIYITSKIGVIWRV